jgi:hypothetical protein
MLLFICGLFNEATSKSDCIMLKDLMNSEELIVKDFEGSSHGLI